MIKTTAAAVLVFCCVAGTAQAQSMEKSPFVGLGIEGGFGSTTIDAPGDLDGARWTFGGSYGMEVSDGLIATFGVRYSIGTLYVPGTTLGSDYSSLTPRAAIGIDLDGLMPYATIAFNNSSIGNASGSVLMYGGGLEGEIFEGFNLFTEFTVGSNSDYDGADISETDIDLGVRLMLGG